MASSQGSATLAPIPRKTARRDSPDDRLLTTTPPVSTRCLIPSLEERVAGHDALHQHREPILARLEILDDPIDDTTIRLLQASPQGIDQQLLGQGAGELARAGLDDRLELRRPAE